MIKILLTIILAATAGIAFSQKTITGRVYDNNHQPLIGASVRVKGASVMTLSKSDGSYTLMIPQGHENDTVEIQYVGFNDQFFLPTGNTHDVVFEVEQTNTFDDIVVSTQKRLQSSIEVPIAVTAIDQNRLDELYATQIDEISCFVAMVFRFRVSRSRQWNHLIWSALRS